MISEAQIRSIEAILKECPLCFQIAHFLVHNDRAIDTVKGVADFWVGHDRIAVQSALDRLVMCGAVIVYSRISGLLYGLTRHQPIRDWLRQRLCQDHLTSATPAAAEPAADAQ